jgi:regulator of protease activity HflC (stomatin/prohibitin superfamily)
MKASMERRGNEHRGTVVPAGQAAADRVRAATWATADDRTFRRGRSAALVGLVIQVMLAIVVGLTGVWAGSPAIHAATWHVLGGVLIWVVLVLIYQQHEAERAESLASEKLNAAGGANAAIFDGIADELLVARNRLARLYAYGLPLVGFLLAAYLVGTGGALLYAAVGRSPGGPALAAGCQPVGLLFVTGASAFLAFIAARWTSGYTRVDAWRLLRGGASYLMSCFVVLGLVCLGAVVAAVFADTTLFEWLALAVPAVMVGVGAEILLTSLLAAYRPKRPGEMPRPAFDSRVLGMLTAPESLGRVIGDLVNYQFGVEISKSWFYELLGRAVTPLTLFGGAVLAGLSCLVIVGPDEQGVVLRCGALRAGTLGPGIHLKLPWPVETASVLAVGRVHEVLVSSDLTGRNRTNEPLLWTSADDAAAALGQEHYLTAPGDAADGGRGSGGGMALVASDVVVQYRVADLRSFLAGPPRFTSVIRAAAQREIGAFFAGHDIDSLLGLDRSTAGVDLAGRLQQRLDRLGVGVEVVGVSITSLHPPIGKVSRAFHGQIGAVQERETLIQAARTDAVVMLAKVAGSAPKAREIDEAIRALDDARGAGAAGDELAATEQRIEAGLADALGEAAERVHAAKAYRWKRTVGEAAAREQFAGELLAYEQAPAYYRSRTFLEVLAAGLAPRRKYVVAGQGLETPTLRMDFNDPVSAMDTLLTE